MGGENTVTIKIPMRDTTGMTREQIVERLEDAHDELTNVVEWFLASEPELPSARTRLAILVGMIRGLEADLGHVDFKEE